MNRAIKIGLLISLCLLLLSCKSKKLTTTSNEKIIDKSVITVKEKEVTQSETKHYGDTLKGIVPLPKLSDKPVLITVESGGQKLELSVTENSLAYKATPKHIATTTLYSVKESDTKAVADVVQVRSEKTVKPEKVWRPPWWWYAIAAGIVVGVYYYVTTPLNPVKKIIKTILK